MIEAVGIYINSTWQRKARVCS